MVNSFSILVTLFLSVLYRPTSFLLIYIAPLIVLSMRVRVRTGVATGVTDRNWSVRVPLAVAAVRKVGI